MNGNQRSVCCFAFFAIIFTLVFCSELAIPQTSWKPVELAKINSTLVDPEEYITTPAIIEEINSYIDKAYAEASLKFQFFVFSEMDPSYTSLFYKDINRFTGELWDLIVAPTPENALNSVLVVMVIKERIIKIVSGSSAHVKIPDANSKFYIKAAMSFIQSSDYEQAVLYLARQLYLKSVNQEEKTLSQYIYTALLYGTVITAILCCCVSCLYYCFNTEEEEDQKLQVIKKFVDEKLPPQKFMEEICALCLQKIVPSEIQDNEGRKKQDEAEPLLCVHKVHPNCLKNWKKISKDCALCKENLNDSLSNPRVFYEGILKIQFKIYPSMEENIEYTFTETTLTYQRKKNTHFREERGLRSSPFHRA